jgi:hypothetical protein
MAKHQQHNASKRFRYIKPWYFLVLAVLCTLLCVSALRDNNLKMIKLRDAVYAADKKGTDTIKPLQDLQAYVTRHMNTNLSAGPDAVHPPVQLKYTYDRLVRAQGTSTAEQNAKIYSDAQAYCEAQNSSDFSGRNRVPCIEQYVSQHTVKTPAANVSDALYKFDFISPKWSPDFAGWAMVLAALSWVALGATLLIGWWFRRAAK